MNHRLALWRHRLSQPKQNPSILGKPLLQGPICAVGLTLSMNLIAASMAFAQQPLVQDLSASSASSFYQQADTQTASDGALVMFNQVQEHQREIQELRGQVEELRYALDQLKQQGQQRYLDTDDRLANLESSFADTTAETSLETDVTPVDASELNSETEQTDDATANAESDIREPEEPSANSTTPPEVQEAYQTAFAYVQAREFDDAISAFNTFVEDHPDTRLTPNGYYWLGELHAANNNLGEAEQAFNKVINEFDGNNKMADALYKLGIVKARQGNTDTSRELLTRVREEHPDSSAAGLAGDFLRQSAD